MADELIKKLELIPYPTIACSKFYFKEVYRSESKVKPLSDDRPERSSCTTIYFLAKYGEYASWRRLKSDETFFHHKGNPLRVAVIKPDGKLEVVLVGDTLKNHKAIYNYTVPAKSVFNLCLAEGDDDYGLISEVSAPGFEYSDIETADLTKLVEQYPQYKDIIEEFTNK